jgi:hypothetical protein
MAKTTGPLYSLSASGKLANAMVYFTWKGVGVCREWLKPANPKSATQGKNRLILGGTGRACGKIYPNPGHTTISYFAQQLITLSLIPGGQTKQSYMVKYIRDHYLTGITAYLAEISAMTALTTLYTALSTLATTLGLVDFSITYDTVATYDKALGLYEMAKTGIALGFSGSPYTAAITAWVAADVTLFGADLTAA